MLLGHGVDFARKSLPPVGAMRQVVYHSDQVGKGFS
jgi:hypothetical protein